MAPKRALLSVLVGLLMSPSVSLGWERDGVKHQWDICYAADGDSLQSVDVYWNDTSKEANVIIFVHGGGWLSGDKADYRDMAEHLAGQGVTVVLVDYRLSPRVKFPAHVDDVAAAIAWAHTSAVKYHGSPEKLYLMGHSAGGYLISLVVADEQYLGRYDLSPKEIEGVITISGVFEIKTQEGGATKKFLDMVFGDDEQIWAQATVHNHIAESKNDLPPFMVTWVEGEEELAKSESLNFVETLKNAGLKYRSFVFEGNKHNAFVAALQDNGSGFSKELTRFMHVAR